jgi:hypothetical protein
MLTVLSCCHANCQLQSVYALNFCLEMLFNLLKLHEFLQMNFSLAVCIETLRMPLLYSNRHCCTVTGMYLH